MDINLIVTWGSLGLFIAVGLLGFIRGIFKGTFRSLSDILFVLLNAVTSALLSKLIMKLILKPSMAYSFLNFLNGFLKNKAIDGVIESIEPYIGEGSFLASAELGYLLAIPAAIITPILFMVVFFLMGIIFKIIKLIVQKLLIPKNANGALRFVGGLLGAVRTALALAIFLVPVIGYATFGIEALHDYDERLGDETTGELVEVLEEYEGVVTEGAFGAISDFGGRWLFETLSTAKVEDSKISLVHETKIGMDIYEAVLPLLEIDMASLTDEDVEHVNAVINAIEQSEYIPAMLASVMSQVSGEAYENGEIMGFQVPRFGESLDPVVKKLLQVWSGTDKAGVVADLRTYADIFASLVENGLFEELDGEDDDIYRVLENGEFYSDILICFYRNERTRPVVPTIANAVQSYLYEIYEEVNGFPYSSEPIDVDENKINEITLNAEGMRISAAIKEFHKFVLSVEGVEYVDEIVKVGDFTALGNGLNQVRDSIFFGNSYRFLLDALLHSETCINLGIFDSNFISSATKPNADMTELLLSRQQLAVLTIAMWDGDKSAQEDALKILIEQVVSDDTDALKEILTPENLEKYGVKGDKGATISAIASSLVDTIHQHEYESEEEKHDEAEKTAHILTVLNTAHESKGSVKDLFYDGTNEAKTDETAMDFIGNVLDSEIASEMIQAALETTGGAVDPYKIHNYLTDNDVSGIESALSEYYNNGTSSFEDKATIKNIADIFGVAIPGMN